MGDIKTHALVSFENIRHLKKISPDEDWIYLELGNFLTDISQYRDPFAHMGAKQKIWRRALFSTGIPILGPPIIALGVGQIQDWLDDLLGSVKKGKNRYGALAEYFTHITLFVTHQLFADNSAIHLLEGGMIPIPQIQLKMLTVEEVNRVFWTFFTQYYPHEHMDFPPYLEGEAQSRHNLYQLGPNKLIGYLEEQIAYLSEEFAKLEQRWLEVRKLPPNHQDRRDALVQFGHLLHSVEDYYFHSNFTEILQWTSTTASYPLRRYGREDDKWFLLRSAFLRTREEQSTLSTGELAQMFRKFVRRLRYPILKDDGTGDETLSLDSKGMIFTGAFTEKDMYHTIYDGLIQLEQTLKTLPKGIGSSLLNSELVLFRLLLNEAERIKMVDQADYLDQLEDRHKKQLLSGEYHQTVRTWCELGIITNEGEIALAQAFSIDRNLQNEYSTTPGIGGFLIMVLKEMQSVAMIAAKKVTNLNVEIDSMKNEATSNGASSETIGTHTLMAKDTDTEGPCREETLALAQYASSALACKLMDRIMNNPDVRSGIDWEVVLKHYLRFPKVNPKSWESTVMSALRNGQSVPAYNEVADIDKSGMLPYKDTRLEQLLFGNMKAKLEQRYIDLEKKVDK